MNPPLTNEAPSARSTCPDCRRPTPTCYCAHIVHQRTRTRIVLLQHPREEYTAIGTARMAHLALVDSILRVGLDFSGDPVVQGALAERPDRYVLFPGPDAIEVDALPDRPITLIVLDGTWWQAKKLLTLNPQLAALPRVGFRPQRPSDYRIRKQPAEFCVSTIEALAEVLGAVEDDVDRFATLLQPFRAMVDAQLRYVAEVGARRHLLRDRRPRVARRPPLAERLGIAASRLVYAYGDANGWPMRHPEWRPAELIHWIALRPADGQQLELVLAPRNPLGPNTARHVELDAACLAEGLPIEEGARRWNAFLRPDDVLVHYGPFHRRLAAAAGLHIPAERFDLRSELLQLGHTQLGGIEACAARLGAEVAPSALLGRAGRRLGTLLAIVAQLTATVTRTA